MEIVIAIGEWFTATVNGLLNWIGVPVTIYTQLVVLIDQQKNKKTSRNKNYKLCINCYWNAYPVK